MGWCGRGGNMMAGSIGIVGLFVGLFVVLAVAALIVLLVVLLARRSNRNNAQVPNALPARQGVQPPVAQPPVAPPANGLTDGALRILNERLAKGEITPDEYETTKTVLLKP